jgi:hypothetical protein
MTSGALAGLVNRTILTMRATVYGRSASGTYTVVAKQGLACRLELVDRQPAPTSRDRAELGATGSFFWDAEYDLPEQAQVVVDAYPGRKWNVVAGTLWPTTLPGSGTIVRSCDVRRAT